MIKQYGKHYFDVKDVIHIEDITTSEHHELCRYRVTLKCSCSVVIILRSDPARECMADFLTSSKSKELPC